MKLIRSVYIIATALTLSSCSVFTKYESSLQADAALTAEVGPSWREYFADPLLQSLIDTALQHNASLATASLRLSQAEENLKAAGMAYLPSVYFSAQGGIDLKKSAGFAGSYNLPLAVQWSYGAPGSIFAKKHQAAALKLQADDLADAARKELVCQIAADYYMLQMLDEKCSILEQTITRWTQSMEIQRELMTTGKTFYTSVAQMESKLFDAKQDLLQVRADMGTMERVICLLSGIPYRTIERSQAGSFPEPSMMESGVYFDQLRLRPDVRAAERDLEIAYYVTSEARSAFFPSIVLDGSLGWPTIVSAAVKAVQPIFLQGTLKRRVNVSRMDEEIARIQFEQVLLQASTEVSQALADHRLYTEKTKLYAQQEAVQAQASQIAEDLSRQGKANYLELIKAQEKLLSAQLDGCESRFKAREAVITLFKSISR